MAIRQAREQVFYEDKAIDSVGITDADMTIRNFMINRKFATYMIIVSVTLLVAGCANGGGDNSAIIDTGVQPTLSATIDSYLAANLVDSDAGLSILVRKDGTAVYKNSKGMANIQAELQINSQTGFRLGSLSKPFVALSIVQLYEQGRLTLDDSILEYLPELPPTWQQITIHQLLSHKSGIPDYLNDMWSETWVSGLTNQKVLQYFSTHDALEFEPGSQDEYSNTGYLFLAEIIARITEVRFADYMASNMFVPLGMTSSYIINENSLPRDTDALNYAQYDDIFGLSFFTYGAMGQVSSIDELNLFVVALLDGTIVSPESLDLMTQVYSDLQQGEYGYGWFIGPPNEDSFTHGGGLDGFELRLLIDRSISMDLISLSNGGQQTSTHMANIYALIREFYGQ